MKTLTLALFATTIYAQTLQIYTTMLGLCGTLGYAAYHQIGTGTSAVFRLNECKGDGT